MSELLELLQAHASADTLGGWLAHEDILAIIAALEDRERLRAELMQIQQMAEGIEHVRLQRIGEVAETALEGREDYRDDRERLRAELAALQAEIRGLRALVEYVKPSMFPLVAALLERRDA